MMTPLTPRAQLLVGLFLFFHVYLAWASHRSRTKVAAMARLPPLTKHFTSVVLFQAFLLIMALVVARALWIPLYPPVAPTPLHLLGGIAAAFVLAGGMLPFWKRAVSKGDRRLYFFMPASGREKALWAGVSLAAAIGEETTYRGVLYVVFQSLTGNAWAAALLSALLFAVAHAFQSRQSIAIIFGFALVFQGLAFWTGALYVPMLTHLVYDLIAGFTYARLGRRIGYRAEGAPEPEPGRGQGVSTAP